MKDKEEIKVKNKRGKRKDKTNKILYYSSNIK